MGELSGKPVFKVPSTIIPTDEILTVKFSRQYKKLLNFWEILEIGQSETKLKVTKFKKFQKKT